MTDQNGLEPAWEELSPEELPYQDELTAPGWLEGQPESDEHRVYAPTPGAGDPYEEGRLGNEETLRGLIYPNSIRGYENVTLGSLLQTGWNWGYDSVQPYSMSKETWAWLKPRIVGKINQRYLLRDLGLSPVARWEVVFRSRLIEILDDLGPLYDQIHDELDILDPGKQQESSINVNSDFPQARLKMKQEDYATDSTEYDKESTGRRAQLDSMLQYQKEYQELDRRVLEHLEQCFSSFYHATNF